MRYLRSKYILIPIFLSTVFAVLLFPSIVGRHGVLKSLYFTQLGVLVIWGVFFLWSWIINSIVEEEIKKRTAGNKHG